MTRLVSGGMYLWKHSVVRIVKEEFTILKNNYAAAETTAIINVAKFVPSTTAPVPEAAVPRKVGLTPQLDVSQLGTGMYEHPQPRSTRSYSRVPDNDEMS